jgi:hypothetical protein
MLSVTHCGRRTTRLNVCTGAEVNRALLNAPRLCHRVLASALHATMATARQVDNKSLSPQKSGDVASHVKGAGSSTAKSSNQCLDGGIKVGDLGA